MTYRAYKYRICPDEAQAGQLARTFGCVRFVYNKCLEEEERRHAAGGPFAGRTALNNWCNRSLKDEFPFLRDVDKFALTNAAWALVGAYERMFDGTARHPRFKSRRRSRRSYTTNLTGSNIAVLDGCVKLPRIGKVKAVIHTVPCSTNTGRQLRPSPRRNRTPSALTTSRTACMYPPTGRSAGPQSITGRRRSALPVPRGSCPAGKAPARGRQNPTTTAGRSGGSQSSTAMSPTRGRTSCTSRAPR